MNDLELPMFSYYVIYYEMFRKVTQQTEKEALKVHIAYEYIFLESPLLYNKFKSSHLYNSILGRWK